MKKITFILLIFVVTMLSVFGCAQTELSTYKSDMHSFYKNIAKIDKQMNSIDPDSSTAVKEMLECLDALDNEFAVLADIYVPTEFYAIDSLADEASEYMTLAVENYNQAFATDGYYDSAYGDVAEEYLARAMKRKDYIATILQGEEPEGSDITVYDGETDIPVSDEIDETDDSVISDITVIE